MAKRLGKISPGLRFGKVLYFACKQDHEGGQKYDSWRSRPFEMFSAVTSRASPLFVEVARLTGSEQHYFADKRWIFAAHLSQFSVLA
jgi:hypothetical protein